MNININPSDIGSLDKTLSSFGLSNIDPQFLNPSLLHNGFMLDREIATTKTQKHPQRKHAPSQYAPTNLPQGYRISKHEIHKSPEYEFLTVRPSATHTTNLDNKMVDPLYLGSTVPTLPPPSGDIPPFVMQQRKYNSKLKTTNAKAPIPQTKGSPNNRPFLNKPLVKSRPPFPPPAQSHISSFDKRITKQNPDHNDGKNPILQLFKNVQEKSSSLSNLFSPKSWFKDKSHVSETKNSGLLRTTSKNAHNFNRRMSPIKTTPNVRQSHKRPLIKMVEGNFHHPAKYRYENPVTQKSRDEKSRRDVLKNDKLFTRKLQKEIENIASKPNLKTPMDIDVAESVQIPVIYDISGVTGKANNPATPGEIVKGTHMGHSNEVPLNTMLKAEQLAVMIEALADEKVASNAMQIGYQQNSNKANGLVLQHTVFDKTYSGNALKINQTLSRPTDKSLLGTPGQGMLPLTNKRKSSYGLGFDPSGIQPESGFKPIVIGEVQSMPSLAFSVLDSMPDEILDTQGNYANTRDMTEIMHPHSSGVSQPEDFKSAISTKPMSNRRMSMQEHPTGFKSGNPMVSFTIVHDKDI